MTTERERVLGIADALGHREPTVWESKAGLFFASCSCGWESTYRNTPLDALGAVVHHALTAAKPVAAKARRSGRPLGAVIADERRRAMRVLPGGAGRAQRDRYRKIAAA